MIPNIVKGRGVTGALAYAMGEGRAEEKKTGLAYALEHSAGTAAPREYKTLAEGESSRADILGGQNFHFDVDSADRLEMARRMMEWNGKAENQASRGRKCENDCLHASLSWEKGQEPTRADMIEAAQGFLKTLGMEKAQAVFVAHNDTEHKHLHIVASRIDPTTGKTYSQEDDFTKAQAWGLKYEREHGQIPQNEQRQNLHKIVDAIEARDGAAIVDNLTQRTPTFSARELDRALSLGMTDKDERAKFRSEILADKNVVGLQEAGRPEAEVTRYTTREILAAEMGLLRSAQKLADDKTHGLSETRVEATADKFTLKPEQALALEHLTSGAGFAMLWGEAGTGKSHTLNAARTAYEAEGYKVVGMAWTNDVVQQMRGDGFKNNTTITSALHGLDDGRTAWGKKTVLIVDEAAMVATDQLAKLAAAAEKAGAKLILAGDDAQLASIERGGMFETLRRKHGAAILEDVQRVADVAQKTAYNQMHKGEFRGALETFDKAGGIHWTEKQPDALRDMAQKYTEDVKADPDKRRFMFAFSNAEVAALNTYARAVHRDRGDLGADNTLKTAHGEATFATGDRIQFSGNGYGKRARDAGFTNGRVGTITDIDTTGSKPRVTVSLDVKKGDQPREISFTVGDNGKAGEFDRFKLGYSGTIYRGQGRTLDQTYVCHSSLWRRSAAYVALTRHRENVHIFAARETVRGVEKKNERATFEHVADLATLDPAARAAAVNARDLDTMAKGLQRKENKRAATAYQIGNTSALRIDFDDVARMTTKELQQAVQSSRGLTRIEAILEIERHRRQAQADASKGQARPAETLASGGATTDRADLLKAAQQDGEARKAALQELSRLFGRELTRQEGNEVAQTRGRGGGQSL
jgi:hypothetical protein